jgi:hypothetical protein
MAFLRLVVTKLKVRVASDGASAASSLRRYCNTENLDEVKRRRDGLTETSPKSPTESFAEDFSWTEAQA